jgi:CRISPR-associated protein Csb2
MSAYLCISIRLLDATFHGRADGNELEWPPSPLRLFQALVCAAAARWRTSESFPEVATPACRWLEALGAPVIVTPSTVEGAPFRLSVPNNAMDVVARAWSRGNTSNVGDANPATHRTMKTVRPMHLLGEDVVHYLWELSDTVRADFDTHKEVLFAAARSVVALGWGIDMAIGNGQLLGKEAADSLSGEGGERWRPVRGTVPVRLRVPRQGTLAALVTRYEAFLNRLPPSGGFIPVPALTTFATIGYCRDTDMTPRPLAAFALLTPDAERFRAFDTVRCTPAVAGMVRHAAGQAATLHRPDDPKWVDTFVRGHGDGPSHRATTDYRFAYIPVPTIEERKQNGRTNFVVGSIRRVLVVEPPGGTGTEVAWVRQRLSGQLLIDEHTRQPMATLSLIPTNDRRLRWYVPEKGATVWSTVTPVILPGYDDNDPRKAERLLRKTLEQVGFPPRLQQEAVLEWRPVGFRPGLDLASRYRLGAHHDRLPRYHMRIIWPVPVRGPLCLGTGRYYGMGLFAAEHLP